MGNLPTPFSNFENFLHKHIEKTWASPNFSDYIKSLSNGATIFSKKIIEIGDTAFEALKDSSKEEAHLPHFITNYCWMVHTKSFLVLWRNSLFEQQKAQILFLDKKIKAQTLRELKMASQSVISEAATDLINFYKKDFELISKDKKGIKKRIQNWMAQQNPYPIYKDQLVQLSKQCQNLQARHEELVNLSIEFLAIKKLILSNVSACKSEISNVQTLSEKTIKFIHENVQEKSNRIAPHLEELESNIPHILHLNLFKTNLDISLKQLVDKIQIPISTYAGVIQTKEISFQKEARQWLESALLPILYEVWELTESVSNGIKMSLLNIRNRAILLTNEQKEGKAVNFDTADLTQPLDVFLKKAKDWEENLLKFERIIAERLTEEFNISAVYNLQQEFLPISLESTLSQFRLNQNEWLEEIKKWLTKKWGFVQNFQKTVKQEEALSLSEKVVRYIQSRTVDAHNSQYASIFLTEGFIGESFWVGREESLNHVKNLIQQWRLGFRGAVILSGQRFSGKSLFGGLVSNQHFPNNTILLTPHSTINIDGRKFTCGFDLKPALDFVLKYTQNKNPLIWIDDLELWASPEIPLGKNVRILKKYIDTHSRKLFFMVSMSTWLKSHLQKTHDLLFAFQAEINLNKMAMEEIREAILIRHGATHKVLVDKDAKEVTPQQFQKMITKIYQTSNGNIGEALNQWSFSTKKHDKERVIHDMQLFYTLPDFSGVDTSILLAAILMEKRTNEFRLSKLFGSPYREKYHPILQRLISNGLLTRHLDGWLEITEGAANDIARTLGSKDYLKFN